MLVEEGDNVADETSPKDATNLPAELESIFMSLDADAEASSSSTTTAPSSLSMDTELSSLSTDTAPSFSTTDTEATISSYSPPPPTREEALLYAPQAPPPAPSPLPPRARLAFNRGRDLEDDFIPDNLTNGEGVCGLDDTDDDDDDDVIIGVGVDLTDGDAFDDDDDDNEALGFSCFACTWTTGDGGDNAFAFKNDAEGAELVVDYADLDVTDLTCCGVDDGRTARGDGAAAVAQRSASRDGRMARGDEDGFKDNEPKVVDPACCGGGNDVWTAYGDDSANAAQCGANRDDRTERVDDDDLEDFKLKNTAAAGGVRRRRAWRHKYGCDYISSGWHTGMALICHNGDPEMLARVFDEKVELRCAEGSYRDLNEGALALSVHCPDPNYCLRPGEGPPSERCVWEGFTLLHFVVW